MKNNKISTDIIIVNYNSTDSTIRCIGSILDSWMLESKRIIVVDNNSNDKSERIIASFPYIIFLKNKINNGFGKAVNLALKHVKANYILLINPDTYINDKSFTKIFDYMENNPHISVCGPKILNADGTVQGSARKFPSFATSVFGRKSPLTKLYPNNSITKREFFCFNGNSDEIQKVHWVSGACMAIRTVAFNQVGGFDERFFLYWEDTDLCKRMCNLGWTVNYFPKVKITHSVGRSSSTCPLKSTFHFHKSGFILYRKHTKWPWILIAPYVAFGLSIRCLFVISLFGLKRILELKLATSSKMNMSGIDNNQHPAKIKVLRIVSRLNIGGPSIHCSILSKGLNKKRFASKVVTGSISPFEGDMGYLFHKNGNLVRIPELQREINYRKDFLALLKTLKIIFLEKPDIVHTHMAKAGAVSRLAVFIHNMVSRKKIKTVHTFHGHVLEGYFSPFKSKLFVLIEKILAKITDAIIAISQTQKWELSEKYKLTGRDKIYTINLGFDLKRFTNKNGGGKLRASLGVGKETILIGIVGRLVPIKNHVLFFDTARIIKDKFINRPIRFVIVGDGEMRKKLEAYSNKIGIQKKVSFLGWSNRIEEIYLDLDYLLLTSDNEGTPVSIIEAMASSVPVVTTGVGGVKDLLGRIVCGGTDNKNYSLCERGILCPKGNPEALANGVEYLIENDNSELVARARDFVFENYTDKMLIERIENLYDSLM